MQFSSTFDHAEYGIPPTWQRGVVLSSVTSQYVMCNGIGISVPADFFNQYQSIIAL